MPQMFELKIEASGEVRDAEGNLISVDPITGTAVVTAEQARAIISAITEGDPS